MGKLIYSAIASLDGFVEDGDGRFDWATPDDEVHTFVNDLERTVGTYLYRRRMYETMVFWESPPDLAEQSSEIQDYTAIWQAAEKVVYSTTLQEPRSGKTRIEREFDPEAVAHLKAALEHDLSIGGAELAAQAIAAGLVDECELFLVPVLVGDGKRALQERDTRTSLELLEQRRFGNGTVFLRYAAG